MAQQRDEIEANASEPPPQGGSEILRIAWRRKSFLLLGAVVGLIFGCFQYARSTPVYQSNARVLVIKKTPEILTGGKASDAVLTYLEDYLPTHVSIIKSPRIVSQAVQIRELASLRSFGGGDPTPAILGGLAVNKEAKEESNKILTLSFKGPVAEECDTILNAVIDSYRDFLDKSYRELHATSLEIVKKAEGLLKDDLAKKQELFKEFRETSPLIFRGKDSINTHYDLLTTIERKRSELVLRRSEISGDLDSFQEAKAANMPRSKLLAMITQSAQKTGPEGNQRNRHLELEKELTPLIVQQTTLLTEYGIDHPKVQTLLKTIQAHRDRNKELEQFVGQPEGPGEDPVDAYIDSLKEKLKNVDASERELNRLSESIQKKARSLSVDEHKEEQFRTDIEMIRKLFEGMMTQLAQVNLTKEQGGYDAQILSPVSPGAKVEPKPMPIFGTAILLGLVGGMGLAYLAELADKSFRSPEEIRRRLGLPVMGHIPILAPAEEAEAGPNGAALDPQLCSYYRPKSHDAEAYRDVRTALYFSTRGEGHNVIQITSPKPADGKSTLSANLAISIAQSDRRVLLIDADFRRPRQHRFFGLSPDVGLASVLAGNASLNDVILSSTVPGLAILPCGPIPPNPAELLTSARFKETLDVLREQYDFVLIDTSPLLSVTDPCVVAPRVDGVLMVIRVAKDSRWAAERAKEILGTLNARVIGVVVNAVATDDSAKYGYGYNYGYGYGYGYGYSYGQDGADGDPSSGEEKAGSKTEDPAGAETVQWSSRKRGPDRRSKRRLSFLQWLGQWW